MCYLVLGKSSEFYCGLFLVLLEVEALVVVIMVLLPLLSVLGSAAVSRAAMLGTAAEYDDGTVHHMIMEMKVVCRYCFLSFCVCLRIGFRG